MDRQRIPVFLNLLDGSSTHPCFFLILLDGSSTHPCFFEFARWIVNPSLFVLNLLDGSSTHPCFSEFARWEGYGRRTDPESEICGEPSCYQGPGAVYHQRVLYTKACSRRRNPVELLYWICWCDGDESRGGGGGVSSMVEYGTGIKVNCSKT